MLTPLRIFPAYGLDNSLLTAVLIGLYVRFFFTEWLGWVFSGLVVPGYLAAIILLRPASAAIIIAEALLTFGIVRSLSAVLARTKLGTPVFGRDRFMWLVVVSVGVRVITEALVVPLLEARLRARLGWDLSDRFGLYGIGLVLVPLLANACWKPGVWRGAAQQIVCTGLTYLLLRGVLQATNLSFSNIALSFEKIALDFAASPKAYLLLLTGALLASRANLRFGWDTSGVVIPGLLCLGWFSPVRLLSTMCEAMLIAAAADLFVRLPAVRDWNIEGPRRVVLTFTIGYILKFSTVAIFGSALPSFTATELFGLGYLLPSLLAAKIWQRRNPAQALVPAFTLSLAGLCVGSIVGYGLVLVDTALKSRQAMERIHGQDGRCSEDVTLLSEVRLARARAARTAPSPAAPRIGVAELESLDRMLRRLRALTAQGNTACTQLAEQVLPGSLGLRLQAARSPSGRVFWTLREATEEPDQLRGFGLLAVAASPQGGPVLIVEQPQHDLTDLTALVALAEAVSADGIVLGGLPAPELGRGDAARDRDVPVRVAASALSGSPLKVRVAAVERPRLSALVPAAIVRSLESELGPLLRSGPTQPTAELLLSPQSELALSHSLLPSLQRYPSTAAWLSALALLPQTAPRPRSPAAELLLADEVIRPLARARVPLDLPALAQGIAGAASEAGFTVALIDGALPRIALLGQSEGLLLSPGAPTGPLVQVASRRLGMTELGLLVFEQQEAHALLLPSPGPGVVDAGPLARLAAPILVLTPPAPDVIVLQSGPVEGPFCAVISDALRLQDAPQPLAQRLGAMLERNGVRCDLHTQYDLATVDPPSPGVDLLRVRAAGDFVTLHAGPDLRERFRPGALSHPQQLLFERLEVPVVRGPLEKLLTTACTEPAPGPAVRVPQDLVSEARTFAATRHPALLERLRAHTEVSGHALSAVEDERYAQAYLLLRGRHEVVAITLRQQGSAAVSLPCNGDVASGIRRAQSAGAASIAVGAP